MLEHVVRELLRVLTRLLGATDEVGRQVLLVDADLLLLGDRVEDELRSDGVADATLEVGLELLRRLALVLEVLLHGQTGIHQLLLDVLATGVELIGDHRLGQRDLDLLEQGFEDGVTRGDGLLEALAATEALLDVSDQLVDGVELGGQLGELLVQLRELLLLDRADLDRDLDVFTDQVTTHELGGEGLLVAGAHADKGLVEPLEHAATTDLVGHAADVAAVDGLAVLHGGQVDGHEVVLTGRALHVDEGAEALTQRLDLLVDLGVAHLDVLDLRLEGVVGRQLEVRLDVDLGGELEGGVVLEPGDLDLGLRERLERVLLHGLGVLLRDDLVDRLVQHDAAADLAVDDGRRDLATAEAGDVDLLGDLLVRLVEARLELLEGHLDGQLGPGGAQVLDGALHRWSPSLSLVPGGTGRCTCQSGRQDSNLRSPAPKAGALATTLRPVK